MPLTVRVRAGVSRPVVVCDHCRRVVKSAQKAFMLWPAAEEGADPAVLFTHAACAAAWPRLWTFDLDVAMVRLARGLGMTDAVRRRAEVKTALMDSLS